MEITYIGHSCFKIKGKTATIIIDPYDPAKVGYKLPKLEGDLLLTSHQHFDHNYVQGVTGYKLLVAEAGEYELMDTFVMGIPTFHDDKEGAERGANTIFYIEVDGFNILHLGDLGHELSKEVLEKVPAVDILLIPVGGTYTIDAKVAAKIVAEIEPYIIVPMHYQTPDLTGLGKPLDDLNKFLHEMGVPQNAPHEDKLKLTSRTDLDDDTKVVILNPQH